MLTYQLLQKSLLFLFASLIVVFGTLSCSNNHQVENTVSLEPVKPKTDLTKESDQQFLVRATEINFQEMLLGKLAQKRCTSEELKEFGRVMEEANRDANSSLASAAILKSIGVPSAPSQTAVAAYDTLNLVSMENFDAAYLRFVIQDHNDLVSFFENATRDNLHPDIKSLASKMLPDLRSHLTRAQEIEAQINPAVADATQP
ncbi:MAG TPA: DUF4142 domain-containing protein [Saprospiraceae bacterium]|nr:DUF4142 domain-containing protein [Saprospiraceae bacterium]